VAPSSTTCALVTPAGRGRGSCRRSPGQDRRQGDFRPPVVPLL